MGLAFLSLTLIGTILCLAVGLTAWEHFYPRPGSQWDENSHVPLWQFALNVSLVLAPFASAAGLFYGAGRVSNRWAVKLEKTAFAINNADHPVPESLLRASAEPAQEQQAVLLRAVRGAPESRAELLLRAVEESVE
jgi:hypothetical protein